MVSTIGRSTGGAKVQVDRASGNVIAVLCFDKPAKLCVEVGLQDCTICDSW